MIKKLKDKRFTIICDVCNFDLRDEGYGRIWEDEQTAYSNAEASEWDLSDDNKQVCPECHLNNKNETYECE